MGYKYWHLAEIPELTARKKFPKNTLESAEPLQTSNFAECFWYGRTCLLQNMTIVAHHSVEKLFFSGLQGGYI
jgi:hypothetical protein